MKLKDGFILRQVAGAWVVVAVGSASVNFNGLLTLNESGVLLWRALENGADRQGLIDAITAEYEVTEDVAAADIDEFLASIRESGCLED